jgi:prepilin-type N-terminal cleavage/methylation domain-containing protein
MKKNNKGFTLIELLVVIAIIGLLATIVMVSLNTARAKARDARRISDVRQLQLALEMYYDAIGSYPAALSGLAPNYINAVPTDPDGSSAYQYCVSATLGYHLGTRATGLESSTHNALKADADQAAGICASGGFSGTDPVYDVIP